MRCFYHPTSDAVGLCKSCGKGLCTDCAVDLSRGLACRGHCEDDVRSIIQLIDRNVSVSPITAGLVRSASKSRLTSAGFSIVIGLVMGGYGLMNDRVQLFSTALGGCFLLYGILQLLPVRRM